MADIIPISAPISEKISGKYTSNEAIRNILHDKWDGKQAWWKVHLQK